MTDTVEHGGRKWTGRQWRFIEWKANPCDKVPGTQAKLADELAITARTPHRWSQRDGFDDAVMKSAIEAVKADLPRLLEVSPKYALQAKYPVWAAMMKIAGYDVDGDRATDSRTQIAIVFGDGRSAGDYRVDSLRWQV